jgi:DNA-directed RNA polymerase subunit RPC12/RpoP
MKCKDCGRTLIKIDRRDEMADFDDDATDGQMADYFAAELAGDNGAWNIGIVEYHCPYCMKTIELVSDQLKDYGRG